MEFSFNVEWPQNISIEYVGIHLQLRKRYCGLNIHSKLSATEGQNQHLQKQNAVKPDTFHPLYI
jgi:hypothetical protein